MSVVRVYQFETNFSSIPNETARDLRISNAARGILIYLSSNKDGFKFLKTNLFDTFGRREVDNTFKELEEVGYLFPVKFRVGKKYKPMYYVCVRPFTAEEKQNLERQARIEIQMELDEAFEKGTGKKYIWDVQFGQFILDCSKRTTSKEKDLKNKKDLKLKDDDDKLTIHQILGIVSKVQKKYPEDVIKVTSFNGVVEKVTSKYEAGEIAPDKFEQYLITCINNKVEELAKKREERKQKSTDAPKASKPRRGVVRKEMIPDWMENPDTQQTKKDSDLSSLTIEDLEEKRRMFTNLAEKFNNLSAKAQLVLIEKEIASRK